MKEIAVQITSKSLFKSYVINLEDEFASNFENDWAILTGGEKYLDAGELLKAFIQKSYENYLQIKELDILIEKLDNQQNG